MRTGILGGTFNPPHLGHLHAARLAREALGLDKVLFIPTNIPPHKALPEDTATVADRCEMVRLLLADTPWARLDTLEVARGGASYTVDTLRALHARGERAAHLSDRTAAGRRAAPLYPARSRGLYRAKSPVWVLTR